MHAALKLTIAITIAEIGAFSSDNSASNYAQVTADCASARRADSAQLLQDARSFASAADLDTFRIDFSIPAVTADSVTFLNSNAACNAAALSYRLYRATRGEADTLLPVFVVRLGPTGRFLGNAPSLNGREREYVVLDSTYTVINSVRAGS